MNLHGRVTRTVLGVLMALSVGTSAALVRPGEPAAGQSLHSFPVTVVGVLAADRLEVEVPERGYDMVKLNGIEIRDCVVDDAFALTRSLALNEIVYLEPSSQPRNGDGDLPVYIWVDGELLNVVLVVEGLAVPSSIPNRYEKTLASASSEAKARKRGGWGNPACRW